MKKTILLLVIVFSINFVNAQDHKEYYDNGQLKESGQHDSNGNGTGEWKIYHENGQLKQIGGFENGEQTGEWKQYHENGSIYKIKLWKEGKLTDIIVCKDSKGNILDKGSIINGNGTVKDYDENGKLTETITYENGEIQE